MRCMSCQRRQSRDELQADLVRLNPAWAEVDALQAPVEGRIGGIVDIPNCSATVSLPLAIFEKDITPTGMLNDRAFWGHGN